MELTEAIKTKAKQLGFTGIGISRAERLDGRTRLEAWLAAGHHGQMLWMVRDPGKRQDPRLILSEIRSVVSLAFSYYTPEEHSKDPGLGRISRYAWGLDYHQVLRPRLKAFTEWLVQTNPNAIALSYSDTGPIMEKAWAHKGGVGWIGKHSNLITREMGSWLFLAEILTNLELEPDSEPRNYCGSCRRCADACPTGAIVEPYVVDTRRCISYLTIELRGPIPPELRPLIGARVFGCDDCQDVCPWNRFAQVTSEESFSSQKGNRTPVLTELMQLTENGFRRRFATSAVKRAKYAGFLRNVAVALGNSRAPEAIPVLTAALQHSEPLVRQHAAWALGQIGGEAAQAALQAAAPKESHPQTLEEIQCALVHAQALHAGFM